MSLRSPERGLPEPVSEERDRLPKSSETSEVCLQPGTPITYAHLLAKVATGIPFTTHLSPMLDSTAVDQIVANVLRQLSAAGTPAERRETRDERREPERREPERREPEKTVNSGSSLSSLVSYLSDRVITGDLLAEKAKGATQIVVPDKAILTPTAHDFLKVSQAQLIRASASGTKAGAVKTDAPAITSWKLITVTSTPAVIRLSGELGAGWGREILGCPDDAAALAISAICRGESGGVVILSKQHFRAACRANRNDKVRAVPVTCPAEVKAAREQLRLNVIAIDPTGRSYFELKNTITAFTGAK